MSENGKFLIQKTISLILRKLLYKFKQGLVEKERLKCLEYPILCKKKSYIYNFSRPFFLHKYRKKSFIKEKKSPFRCKGKKMKNEIFVTTYFIFYTHQKKKKNGRATVFSSLFIV